MYYIKFSKFMKSRIYARSPKTRFLSQYLSQGCRIFLRNPVFYVNSILFIPLPSAPSAPSAVQFHKYGANISPPHVLAKTPNPSFRPSRMSHQSCKRLHSPQLIRQWQMTPRRAQIPNKLLWVARPIIPLLPTN